MYAAHMAAGLALKTAEPKAPTWAVLTAAFLPDFLWIGLASVGIEPANDKAFSDGWSHSALSILVEATLFALCFRRYGTRAAWVVWAACMSHLVLDLPIHPQPLELFPHAELLVGPALWSWGATKTTFGMTRYSVLQSVVAIALLAIYAWRARRSGIEPNITAASVIIVLALRLLF